MTQVPMTLTKGQRSRSKFPQNGLNVIQLAISWMLFHPQTSYLLSQLFVIHLGVALLLTDLPGQVFELYKTFYIFFFRVKN